MINQVTLIGHAGRDIEVRTLENGTKVGTFSLATTESWKDKSDEWHQQTEWHNIVIWRPSATIEKIKKGDKVFIQGKITTRKYQKDDIEHQRTEIVAHLVRGLDTAKSGTSQTTDLPDTGSNAAPNIGFDDDLPF